MPHPRLAAALLAALVSSIGCERRPGQEALVPERGTHVRRPPTSLPYPVISGGDMYIVYGETDSLAAIAAKYGTTIEWLIRRNRLTAPIKPGDNLIVPHRLPDAVKDATAP